MPTVIDLFAGRLGWSKAFLEIGWKVIAFDLVMPDMEIPADVDYRLVDILTLTATDLAKLKPDFAVCSSPCEQFSVHGMKHFHPNPPYPEFGLRLFNHSRALLEALGVRYVMENVRPAQNFVGRAVHHCGPFYLWGNAVPHCFPNEAYRVRKGIDVGSSKLVKTMDAQQRRQYRAQFIWNQAWSTSAKRGRDTAKAAEIPLSISRTVAKEAAMPGSTKLPYDLNLEAA